MVTIVNGKPDDVEIWPAEINFTAAHNAGSGAPMCVMNVKTPNIGGFNMPIDPTLAHGIVCNLTQWLVAVASGRTPNGE